MQTHLLNLGFVTLAFDQVYMGESAGEPRHVVSPDLYAESFSAAVDYLGTMLIVNKLALLVSVGALGLLLVLRLLIRELNLL
ncbi:membrane protein [Limosilactobacillus reuteri]|uniref:Membrane protein n=1 Tax=Limosilactobacillus reuteri TaxID=1598 RepID=A0A2S1ESQ0_LIMRT|nr:membrane protein [Limosilactobacillus reuteri]